LTVYIDPRRNCILVYSVKLASVLYFVNYFILISEFTLTRFNFVFYFDFHYICIEEDNLTLKIVVPIVIVVAVVGLVVVVVYLWRTGALKKFILW